MFSCIQVPEQKRAGNTGSVGRFLAISSSLENGSELELDPQYHQGDIEQEANG